MCLVILCLALAMAATVSAEDVTSSPRLFPAAKQEQYDSQTHTLRTLQRFDRMKFVLRGELYEGASVANAPIKDDDDPVLVAATKRFMKYIKKDLPDYAEEYYPVNPQKQTLNPVHEIHLVITAATGSKNHSHHPLPSTTEEESYQIQVDLEANSNIEVQAKTVFGIVRGLESLAQLFEFGWTDTEPNTKKADKFPVHIIRSTPLFVADVPTYPYRGLMIDTARHYLPLSLILDNLNVMTMNKFNVLHWHMTDSQSWPFQSTTYPELSAKGAWSPHAVYSHTDVQTVIHEAYLRGIRVIPEFDLPGHSQILVKSHPELMSNCGGAKGEPLNPTLPEVYDFVGALYQEVAALFPDSFMHIGGDEVNLDCWKQDPAISGWGAAHGMATANELLNYFESILTDIVASCDKTPIAWQELLNEGVDLPPGTVIDVWKGFDTKTIENATKRNYPVIISGCWYLDHLGDNWKKYYDCEPLAFNGTQAQKDLIMGGHASMWGEHVDATNFMARVWPRASAVAERLWSGSLPQAYHDVLSKTITERIVSFRCFMMLRGVSAQPIQPGACRHEQPFHPAETLGNAQTMSSKKIS